MVNKVVLVTGGFDPLHSGHIDYFKAAKRLGDILIVGVNSDSWLRRKKGREFMPSYERVQIIENLRMVDHCILFNDTEDHAIEAIRNVKIMYPNSTIIFANGGDRTEKNIPEMTEPDVIFEFGVGGTIKKNSSSWILEEYKAPKTDRPWGYYRVLHEVSGTKVKELTINPGQSLTMQRHYDRDEHWHVAEGACTVDFEDTTTKSHIKLKRHDQFTIKAECWHKLQNPTDTPCKIVEIQYGITCVEEDIERR
jgi:D-beta-D-heptose 7-phosphate kinase/D-beta-D-heptose 1-phosphate adenosyltransferase